MGRGDRRWVALSVTRLRPVYKGCKRCIDVCPMGIFSTEEKTELEVEGKRFEMAKLSAQSKQRCRWSEHSLIAEGGARTNICPPEVITTRDYVEAGARMDPIQKGSSGIFGGIYFCGRCVHVCPVGDNRIRPAPRPFPAAPPQMVQFT